MEYYIFLCSVHAFSMNNKQIDTLHCGVVDGNVSMSCFLFLPLNVRVFYFLLLCAYRTPGNLSSGRLILLAAFQWMCI
jgi:hypothetical protein